MEYLLLKPHMPTKKKKKLLEKCKNLVWFAYILIELTLRFAPQIYYLVTKLSQSFIYTLVSHAVFRRWEVLSIPRVEPRGAEELYWSSARQRSRNTDMILFWKLPGSPKVPPKWSEWRWEALLFCFPLALIFAALHHWSQRHQIRMNN